MTDRLLDIQNLSTEFNTLHGRALAVNQVSMDIRPGEIAGVVGESGSGKSVTALSVIRLIKSPPGRVTNGRVLFDGTDLLALDEAAFAPYRGKRIAMIFQEPMTSLNPLLTVGRQLTEMIRRHLMVNRKEARERAVEMLQKVQIPSPHKRMTDFPFQMSGGMRQRVMIAIALSCEPDLLIADEPTTALDVTIQAQILDLILELKEEMNTAVMMITHDLGVVAETTQRVNVMYAGRIVEQGLAKDIFETPRHPYTQSLLAAVPRLGERSQKGRRCLQEIKGIVPSLFEMPRGCSFSPRCPLATARCREAMPELLSLDDQTRVRCHLMEGGGI